MGEKCFLTQGSQVINTAGRTQLENHHFVAITELSVDARVSERLLGTGYLQTHISQMTQTGYIAKGKKNPLQQTVDCTLTK